MSLSERIRDNSEAAPWVVREIIAMEQQITELQREKFWLESSIAGIKNLRAEDARRIAELQAEVTRLSGASGCCLECERLSRENAELKRIIAERKEMKPVACINGGELAWVERSNHSIQNCDLFTSPPIQEGMVAVPELPTERMVDAAHKTIRDYDKYSGYTLGWMVYKAMIEASKEKI